MARSKTKAWHEINQKLRAKVNEQEVLLTQTKREKGAAEHHLGTYEVKENPTAARAYQDIADACSSRIRTIKVDLEEAKKNRLAHRSWLDLEGLTPDERIEGHQKDIEALKAGKDEARAVAKQKTSKLEEDIKSVADELAWKLTNINSKLANKRTVISRIKRFKNKS